MANEVRQNLKKVQARLQSNAVKGVIRSQMIVRGKAIPKTPVRTGNLRNAYTTPPPRIENGRVVGFIGNTAAYAPFVHENLEADFRAPGTGPKFLEEALNESHAEVLSELRKATRLE